MTDRGAGGVAANERPRPVVLVVIDGFGIGPDPSVDAIAAANMPAWRALLAEWPHAKLRASEDAVGLPPGQMGNSEVGHLNLGAGRPVVQDLPRVDAAIADGSFFTNPTLVAAVDRAAQPGRRLHLIGLVGPGGVHSHDRHAVAIAELAARHGARDVVVHGLLDGRDTPPRSAAEFVPDLERRLSAAHPHARIATLGGRYYAMDRDKHWERIKKGYDAIVHGLGRYATSATAALEDAYAREENDEFVAPTVIDGVDGRVRDGDTIIHFNFRADRARELTHALVDGDDFTFFDRGRRPRDLLVVTLTEYEEGLAQAAFPPLRGDQPRGSLLGPRLAPVPRGRDREVRPRDLLLQRRRRSCLARRGPPPGTQPAGGHLRPPAGDECRRGRRMRSWKPSTRTRYDFIVANFANPDMVGHTGVWDATVRAVESSTGASTGSPTPCWPRTRSPLPPGGGEPCWRSPPTTATRT